MSKEETLVELAVLEDPLCGEERYFLTMKPANDGFDYYEGNSQSEGSRKLASSTTLLTTSQIADLLTRNFWFRCDIILESLEDSQLAHPEEWVYGGEYPLLSCASKHDEIPEHFRKWVKAHCAKILAQREDASL